MTAAAVEETRALIRSANAGDPGAMVEIGRRLLVGRGAPLSVPQGAAMVLGAAERGDAEALALSAVIVALGLAAPANWDAALGQLRKAAAAGHLGASRQLLLLDGLGNAIGTPESVSTSPRAWWVRSLAPPEVCAWLTGRADGRTELATVYDAAAGALNANAYRSNSLFEFNLAELDLVTIWVRRRLARALAVRETQLEESNVLHYLPGQQFGRHFDFIQPNAPAFASELAQKGQRIATALIYLNDDFEGGETEFVMPKLKLRGAPGDALFFSNVGPAGEPDIASLHAGLAPTAGEKWLFSQFVRAKPLYVTL